MHSIIHLQSHIKYAYEEIVAGLVQQVLVQQRTLRYKHIAMWLHPLLLTSLGFVGRSKVMYCIAPFACALKH